MQGNKIRYATFLPFHSWFLLSCWRIHASDSWHVSANLSSACKSYIKGEVLIIYSKCHMINKLLMNTRPHSEHLKGLSTVCTYWMWLARPITICNKQFNLREYLKQLFSFAVLTFPHWGHCDLGLRDCLAWTSLFCLSMALSCVNACLRMGQQKRKLTAIIINNLSTGTYWTTGTRRQLQALANGLRFEYAYSSSCVMPATPDNILQVWLNCLRIIQGKDAAKQKAGNKTLPCHIEYAYKNFNLYHL